MLNKIATSNRVRGKGLKLKRFSGKFCVLVCASFLISVSTQATHPEFEDWSFDQDGNFYTSTGQQIKPWDQPQALRQARNVGPDEVQALLDNSALRIVQCDNGDFVLHLHGRLRGRGGGQSTSRGDGGNGGSFPSCRNAGPSDRFCRIAPTYTNTDYQRDRQMSRETGITTVTIKGDRIVRNPHYGSSRDRGRSRDRTETTGSGGTITYIDGIEVPNDFLAFAEKYPEAAYRKYQHLKHDHLWRATKVFTVANKSIRSSSPPRASQKKGSVSDKVLKVWQQRVGHKVHVRRPYVIGVNVQGDVGVQDPRTGIVYTLFEGSRKHTDAYLPGHYPKQTQDYPAQDIQMGQWILGKYGDYKLTLNKALIREGEDLSCAPMRRVLLEDRTTKAMLATFGIVLNTMGPDKLYQLGKKYSQTNPNSGPAMMEAAQWLYMFRKPEKYFVVNMEKPLTSFKGELITHALIPDHIRAQWHKRPSFTQNARGTLAVAEPRNGLTYPVYGQTYYGKHANVLLPKGYSVNEEHMVLGTSFIQAAGDCGQEILQEVLGIPKEAQAGWQAVLTHPATAGACRHLTTKVGGLVASGGLALSTMLENGEFGKAVLRAAQKGIEGLDRLVEALRGNLNSPSALEQLRRVEEKLREHAQAAAGGDAQEPPSDGEESDREEGKEDSGDFKWEVKDPKDAAKVGRGPYGKIYKDPTQKIGNKDIYWSKDRAGHGGSRFKLFKKQDGSLKHFADVDELGNVLNKHKGPTGKNIRIKDIQGKL
jgi:hypothetical protein